MVKLLFHLSLFLVPLALIGQEPLQVDAGEDKHFCGSDVEHDSIYRTVGGEPTVQGGTPPYTYRWYLTSPVTYLNAVWHASDILDDTTKSNPIFLSAPAFNDKTLYIEVTDSLGQKVSDNLIYTKSHFIVLLNQAYIYPEDRDTIEIRGSSFDPSFPIVDQYWHDSTGFIDPANDPTPRLVCHHDSTPVTYDITYFDTFNCTLTVPSYQLIFVSPTGISSNHGEQEVMLYPNPVKVKEPITVADDVRILSLATSDGKSLAVEVENKRLFIESPGCYITTFLHHEKVYSQTLIVTP